MKIIANAGEEANLSRPKDLSYTTNMNLFHRSIYLNYLQLHKDNTPYMTEKFALADLQYSLEY